MVQIYLMIEGVRVLKKSTESAVYLIGDKIWFGRQSLDWKDDSAAALLSRRL
jgi:hypothetical protein